MLGWLMACRSVVLRSGSWPYNNSIIPEHESVNKNSMLHSGRTIQSEQNIQSAQRAQTAQSTQTIHHVRSVALGARASRPLFLYPLAPVPQFIVHYSAFIVVFCLLASCSLLFGPRVFVSAVCRNRRPMPILLIPGRIPALGSFLAPGSLLPASCFLLVGYGQSRAV